MMITFIAKIKTPYNGLLEFSFASIETIQGKKFFITTIDKKAMLHVFYMRKIDDSWRIELLKHATQKWIIDLEYDLAQLIQQKG